MSGSIKGSRFEDGASPTSAAPDDEVDLEAYRELMGEEDEVDVFFILPALDRVAEAADDLGVTVLRISGLPDEGTAWVH